MIMQKKFAILLASATTIALTVAGIAPARAVSFGTSWDTHCVAGNTPQACSLQGMLNHYTTGGPPIDTTQDTGYELFTSAGGNAASSFLFSLAGNAHSNTFGLYKVGEPNTKIQLFGGGTTLGQQSLVSFLANGAIKVGSQTVQGFGTDFGFYMDGPGGHFFSQKGLNGGNQQAAIYKGNGQTILNVGGQNTLFSTDKLLVAFEDLALQSSDSDYNDMVLLVSGVKSKHVPEPALMFGLAGVAGAAISRRRKRA
jgi:Domain of unknown function (DUF4114)